MLNLLTIVLVLLALTALSLPDGPVTATGAAVEPVELAKGESHA